ncbi:MAG: hypothetical protein AB1730_15340 [Myxococcota bacterium]|jgi:hypothetical protein
MFIRTILRAVIVLTPAMLACSEPGRHLELVTASDVEVRPPEPLVTPPVLEVLPVAPVYQYAEPLPLPARHVVTVTLVPAGARRLRDVQRVNVDVTVDRGAVGQRRISAAFVSPQGLAWETQHATVDLAPGGIAVAHFSLPVASTFIEDQNLFGAWQVTTLDDGVETAAAGFEVTP